MDADLVALIRGDSAAQSDPAASREYLEFDPFTLSLDACPRYEVIGVRSVGHTYRVTVSPICTDPHWQSLHAERPIVEVVPVGAGWGIGNAWWAVDDSMKYDLKSALCENAKADKRPERRPARC